MATLDATYVNDLPTTYTMEVLDLLVESDYVVTVGYEKAYADGVKATFRPARQQGIAIGRSQIETADPADSGAGLYSVGIVEGIKRARQLDGNYLDGYGAGLLAADPGVEEAETVDVPAQPEALDHLSEALARLASMYGDDVDE